MAKEVAILGVGMHPWGKWGKNFVEYGIKACNDALDDAGLEWNDIEVVAGTEVLWTNNGRNDHNVLPVDESQTWGVDTEDFTPGDEYPSLFDTPGTYLYYCSIHGTKTVGMVGSVTVLAPGA